MKQTLSPHKETALALDHITEDAPVVPIEQSVDQVLILLKKHKFKFKDAILVTNAAGQFMGYLTYPDLLTAPGQTLVKDILHHAEPIAWNTDEEHAAGHAVRHALGWVPVLTKDNRFLGVINSHQIQKILRAEHIEDLHLLSGIHKEDRRSLDSIATTPTRRVRDRLPWLLLGLLISSLSAYAISSYEEMLAKNFAIFFFVPTIVYLADAVGTQTEAIVVRGISLSRLSFAQMFWSEMHTGWLIGLILGAISTVSIGLIMQDWKLAVSVGSAIFSSAFMAASLGLIFPWILNSLGKDPAYGSGPIATVVQDTLTVIIYFFIAHLIIG